MDLGTKFLDELINKFNDIFAAGSIQISGQAINLLATLVVIEITLSSLVWALTGSEAIEAFLKKILVIGFFKYLIDDYDVVTRAVVAGFSSIGSQAAGVTAISIDQPSKIVSVGIGIITKIFEFLASQGTMSFFSMSGIVNLAILLLLGIILFGSYLILALQVVLCRIEFGLVSTLGLILIPFGVFKPTAFIAEKVFGAIISFGVKLMVLSFVVGVGVPLIASYTVPDSPSWFELLDLIPPVLSIVVLAIHAPGVVAALMSGSPSLSASSVVAPALLARKLYTTVRESEKDSKKERGSPQKLDENKDSNPESKPGSSNGYSNNPIAGSAGESASQTSTTDQRKEKLVAAIQRDTVKGPAFITGRDISISNPSNEDNENE